MKYVILLLIVALVLGWLRHQRKAKQPTSSDTPAPAQDMVACLHCGVHVPQLEATQGQRGAYCCVAHRQVHEG